MRIKAFIQRDGSTTLDQIQRLATAIEPAEVMFSFAYATLSGCAEFQRRLGDTFWSTVQTKWLLGIDYGRTQPAALDFLAARANADVRIFDGNEVVNREGFQPRQDFHLKACVLERESAGRFGMLAGSGNFSKNGLSTSLECGIALTAFSVDEYQRVIRPVYRRLRSAWHDAAPVADIIDIYRNRWLPVSQEVAASDPIKDYQPADFDRFWIDVGYVTRNRGPERPGNQIDMPRGVHEFFGLTVSENLSPNSTIGDVTFATPEGELVRHLRFGNNMMEKITLPFPELYDFGAYDGKNLEFRRTNGAFRISAYEPDEFERLLSRSEKKVVHRMGSGRLYGYRRA